MDEDSQREDEAYVLRCVRETQMRLDEEVQKTNVLKELVREARKGVEEARRCEGRLRRDEERRAASAHDHQTGVEVLERANTADRAEDSMRRRRAEISKLRAVVDGLQLKLDAAAIRSRDAEESTGPFSKGRERRMQWQLETDRKETEEHELARKLVLGAERRAQDAEMRALEASHLTRKRALATKLKALDEMTKRAVSEERRAKVLEAQAEEMQRQRQHRRRAHARAPQSAGVRVGISQVDDALELQRTIAAERAAAAQQALDAERRAHEADCACQELRVQLAVVHARQPGVDVESPVASSTHTRAAAWRGHQSSRRPGAGGRAVDWLRLLRSSGMQ